jgi:hypothetical protein
MESEYHFEEKEAKEGVIAILWAAFTVFFTAGTLVLFFLNFDALENAIPMDGALTGIMLISTFFLYMILKFVVTFLFCGNKKNTIRLKMLEKKAIPVCFCREVFRAWQIILIYIIPFVLMSAGLIFLGLVTGSEAGFFIIFLFMQFFMGLDLALVAYIIYIKIKYKPDYIAINEHVYHITLYSKIYIKIKKRKVR